MKYSRIQYVEYTTVQYINNTVYCTYCIIVTDNIIKQAAPNRRWIKVLIDEVDVVSTEWTSEIPIPPNNMMKFIKQWSVIMASSGLTSDTTAEKYSNYNSDFLYWKKCRVDYG